MILSAVRGFCSKVQRKASKSFLNRHIVASSYAGTKHTQHPNHIHTFSPVSACNVSQLTLQIAGLDLTQGSTISLNMLQKRHLTLNRISTIGVSRNEDSGRKPALLSQPNKGTPQNHQPQHRTAYLMKLRRWHMNRHRLLRVRKKMRMVYRKRDAIHKKRRMARLAAAVAVIKQDGEKFDALEFVKERLDRAKRGGYKHDIWKSLEEQPQVEWEDYAFPLRGKVRRYEPSQPVPSLRNPKKLKKAKEYVQIKRKIKLDFKL